MRLCILISPQHCVVFGYQVCSRALPTPSLISAVCVSVCPCICYILTVKNTYSTIKVTTYLQSVAILAAPYIRGPFRGFQAEVRTGLASAWDGPQTLLSGGCGLLRVDWLT